MYERMYERMYIRMYVHMYVRMYARMYVCTYVCTHASTYIYTISYIQYRTVSYTEREREAGKIPCLCFHTFPPRGQPSCNPLSMFAFITCNRLCSQASQVVKEELVAFSSTVDKSEKASSCMSVDAHEATTRTHHVNTCTHVRTNTRTTHAHMHEHAHTHARTPSHTCMYIPQTKLAFRGSDLACIVILLHIRIAGGQPRYQSPA